MKMFNYGFKYIINNNDNKSIGVLSIFTGISSKPTRFDRITTINNNRISSVLSDKILSKTLGLKSIN